MIVSKKNINLDISNIILWVIWDLQNVKQTRHLQRPSAFCPRQDGRRDCRLVLASAYAWDDAQLGPGRCTHRLLRHRRLTNWQVWWFKNQQLIGGLEHECYFPFHIWDVILPIDELIFFKMVKTTNQTMLLLLLRCRFILFYIEELYLSWGIILLAWWANVARKVETLSYGSLFNFCMGKCVLRRNY